MKPVPELILLIFVGLIFTLLLGTIFSIRLHGKSLMDILLKRTARIPMIKSVVKFFSQIIEAGESIPKKKNKLCLYAAPDGRKILGLIKPRKSTLSYPNKPNVETVVPFYEAFVPYFFSGRVYLIETKYLYEVKNIKFEGLVKLVATAGLLFKLPKDISLEKLKIE